PPRCCLSSGRRRVLHSSPTRRSSDLGQGVELRSFLQRSHQVAALQGRHHPAVEFFRAERLAQEIVGAMLDELGAERAFGIGGNADRKSTRLNSSHVKISYAVFCLKKK